MTAVYHIATAPRSAHNPFRQQSMTWAEFVEWLELDHPAPRKDCGNYVGGLLRNGYRAKDTVLSRSLVVLDADRAEVSFVDDVVTALDGTALVFYTTWRHAPEAPRWRAVAPLSREVSPTEYTWIVDALMHDLGPEQFDTGSHEAERLMHRPSTQRHYGSRVVEGEPLDADVWIVRAKELGLDRVPDVGAPNRAPADVTEPPTDAERDKAETLLKKAERGVAELVGWRGEPVEGRNRSCIVYLPLLYRFVLGGCLDENEVDERIWAATLAAPAADDEWSEREYEEVAGRAWGYARTSGPARPEIEDPVEDFEPVAVHVPRSTPVRMSPETFFDGDKGLLVSTLAYNIGQQVTYDVGPRDDRFYIYDRGAWVLGQHRIEQEVVEHLGERYRKSHLTNVVDVLKARTPRRIDGGPTPRWVNCRNGLVDWREGKLYPHSPDVPSVVQLPVEWDPDGECPAVEKFLREVLPEDLLEPVEGGPGFIWELLGYAVYSGNPLHIAVLLYGSGRNGKGALLRLLTSLLGESNVSSVDLHDLVENRFRSATLFGKIANIAGDLDARWLGNTARFKALTGGDLVQAEIKYGAAFDFTPWALPIYSTNKAFGSADSSEGYFARWVVVPFPNSFLGREDRNLDARLTRPDELRGVLARAVAALPALMDRGRLPEPESVLAAKHGFAVSGDAVRAWIDECCDLDPEAWTPRRLLYEHYKFCQSDAGARLLSAREVYNRLDQIGSLRSAKRKGVRGYVGIRLRAVED